MLNILSLLTYEVHIIYIHLGVLCCIIYMLTKGCVTLTDLDFIYVYIKKAPLSSLKFISK